MWPGMEKPKREVGNGAMEFTVADGKFPNHIMTVGLCRTPNEIHYVAHKAWDSGTVQAKNVSLCELSKLSKSSDCSSASEQGGPGAREHPFPPWPWNSGARSLLKDTQHFIKAPVVRGSISQGPQVLTCHQATKKSPVPKFEQRSHFK